MNSQWIWQPRRNRQLSWDIQPIKLNQEEKDILNRLIMRNEIVLKLTKDKSKLDKKLVIHN